MKNRSVPAEHILPHVFYENVADARSWLIDVVGFVEYFHIEFPKGELHGVMMHYGDAWIMLKNAGKRLISPANLGVTTQSIMVFVEDVAGHYERTHSSGATIVQELFDTEYGQRQYSVLDPEGHLWEFSQHVQDVSPESFGAILAEQ